MQQLHLLQLNPRGCTDPFDHYRWRMQVVQVFVPQNIHPHTSSLGHIYNITQYDEKTQDITKSILGKALLPQHNVLKNHVIILICYRIVGDWEHPFLHILSKLGHLYRI